MLMTKAGHRILPYECEQGGKRRLADTDALDRQGDETHQLNDDDDSADQ